MNRVLDTLKALQKNDSKSFHLTGTSKTILGVNKTKPTETFLKRTGASFLMEDMMVQDLNIPRISTNKLAHDERDTDALSHSLKAHNVANKECYKKILMDHNLASTTTNKQSALANNGTGDIVEPTKKCLKQDIYFVKKFYLFMLGKDRTMANDIITWILKAILQPILEQTFYQPGATYNFQIKELCICFN